MELSCRLLEGETHGVAIEATWVSPTRTFGKILGWRLRYGKRPNSHLSLPRNEQEKIDMKEIVLNDPLKNQYTIQDLGELICPSIFFF